jgi:hypothetical protein
VGAHYIRDELKNDFFQLIKSIYQRTDSSKNIELKFIDNKMTDQLYWFLRWCSDFDVIIIKEEAIYRNIELNKEPIKRAMKNL